MIPEGSGQERKIDVSIACSAGAPAEILHHAIVHQAAPDRFILIGSSDAEDGIEKTAGSHIRE